MTIALLDRRTGLAIGAALTSVALAMVRLTSLGYGWTPVVSATESIPQTERRLWNLRRLAATVPAKEALLKQSSAELRTSEVGILHADTSAQAQAQLLDTIHRIAAQNGFDARGAEEFRDARPLGNDYGEVSVTESFTCGIDQLVNFLTDISREPLILATDEIQISRGNDRTKNLNVRLSVLGVVTRTLVPTKTLAVPY